MAAKLYKTGLSATIMVSNHVQAVEIQKRCATCPVFRKGVIHCDGMNTRDEEALVFSDEKGASFRDFTKSASCRPELG